METTALHFAVLKFRIEIVFFLSWAICADVSMPTHRAYYYSFT